MLGWSSHMCVGAAPQRFRSVHESWVMPRTRRRGMATHRMHVRRMLTRRARENRPERRALDDTVPDRRSISRRRAPPLHAAPSVRHTFSRYTYRGPGTVGWTYSQISLLGAASAGGADNRADDLCTRETGSRRRPSGRVDASAHGAIRQAPASATTRADARVTRPTRVCT